MGSDPGPSLFPLHRCKTLHLVRHAQGTHNAEGNKNSKAYYPPEYFDAPLTPLGWQQVDHPRNHVQACGLSRRIDLVIVSPLLRQLLVFLVVGTTLIGWMYCHLWWQMLETVVEQHFQVSIPHHFLQWNTVEIVWVFVLVMGGKMSATINYFFLQLIFHRQIETDEDTVKMNCLVQPELLRMVEELVMSVKIKKKKKLRGTQKEFRCKWRLKMMILDIIQGCMAQSYEDRNLMSKIRYKREAEEKMEADM